MKPPRVLIADLPAPAAALQHLLVSRGSSTESGTAPRSDLGGGRLPEGTAAIASGGAGSVSGTEVAGLPVVVTGNCELVVASESVVAIARVQTGWPDVVILGHRPTAAVRSAGQDVVGWDGVALLEAIRRVDATVPVIVIASTVDVQLATHCVRHGVGELLVEPIVVPTVMAAIERLVQAHRDRQETELLKRQQALPHQFDDFVGHSPAMRKVFERIEQVATTDVDVLIIGETGTGKELVARSIHERSRRSKQPFVAVDCGAIPENLLESEFFGHERGAFTGADSRRMGLLEYADGGTFFLDEIGELPLLLQAKLLRTLQERKLRRVGGRDEIRVDVRIVAATARNLESMIQEKRFREDLYYRVNVVRIDLPPLRQRGDDLGLLAEHFSQRYSREMGKAVVGLSPEAYNVMTHYRWPGNVRELQNVIRRGIALSTGSMISLDALPDELVVSAGKNVDSYGQAAASASGFFAERDLCVARFEKDYLTGLLVKHHGNVKAAALEAQLPRGTLYRLMKNHQLDGDKFR